MLAAGFRNRTNTIDVWPHHASSTPRASTPSLRQAASSQHGNRPPEVPPAANLFAPGTVPTRAGTAPGRETPSIRSPKLGRTAAAPKLRKHTHTHTHTHTRTHTHLRNHRLAATERPRDGARAAQYGRKQRVQHPAPAPAQHTRRTPTPQVAVGLLGCLGRIKDCAARKKEARRGHTSWRRKEPSTQVGNHSPQEEDLPSSPIHLKRVADRRQGQRQTYPHTAEGWGDGRSEG